MALLLLLFLLGLLLLLEEAVLVLQFLVEGRPYSRECKVLWNFSFFKASFDFVFENYKLLLHFRVDISLLVSGPKSPEGIANDISLGRLHLLAEYVLSKLQKDVLPLEKLCFFLLSLDALVLRPQRILNVLCRFGLLLRRVLKDKLLHLSLIGTTSILRGLLRSI